MSNQSLIDAYLVWLEHNKGRSPETSRKYGGYLARLMEHFKERDLLHLNREEIEIFAGAVMVKAGLAGKSRRALVAAIRGFYAWLKREGRIDVDPAADIPYPKVGKKLPIPITLQNAELLIWQPDLSTFLGLRDASMFAVMIGCGVRISGLVGLHDEDLVVVGSGNESRILLKVKEKGSKERMIPLPREAQTLLSAYLGHPDLDQIKRQADDGRHVLFVSTRKPGHMSEADYAGEARRISPRTVYDRVVLHGTRAGIPKDQLHPHAMRHLYGAELAEDDTNILVSQALLGHASPSSTEIYSHLAMRKLARTADKSNPLAKIKTPVSDLLNNLNK